MLVEKIKQEAAKQWKYPEVPVSAIDMRTYGLMDGKGVLEDAEKLMK